MSNRLLWLLTSTLLLPALTNAVGLGPIKLHSHLNQPFNANIKLLSVENIPADEIRDKADMSPVVHAPETMAEQTKPTPTSVAKPLFQAHYGPIKTNDCLSQIAKRMLPIPHTASESIQPAPKNTCRILPHTLTAPTPAATFDKTHLPSDTPPPEVLKIRVSKRQGLEASPLDLTPRDYIWNVSFLYGRMTNHNLSYVALFNYSFAKTKLYSIEGTYQLAPDNWLRRISHRLLSTILVGVNGTYQNGINGDIYEFNPFIMARWQHFPWDKYLVTTFAFAEGLSRASRVPSREQRDIKKMEYARKFLNLLLFEVTIALPSHPDWQIGIPHSSSFWSVWFVYIRHHWLNCSAGRHTLPIQLILRRWDSTSK